MGRTPKQVKDDARSASKARGAVKPKPIAGPYVATVQEAPANFDKRNMLGEIAASILGPQPALALAETISRFTFANYSVEEVERAVFDSDDLSKFPYDVMMRRGLCAPPGISARLLASSIKDWGTAEKEIECFATRLICWSPEMAMPLVAASDSERIAMERKARDHYQDYVATIAKDEEAPTKFARAILRLSQIDVEAARALVRGDLGGAVASIRRIKAGRYNGSQAAAGTKSEDAVIFAAFEWAEAIWCCFDLQWNVAFWRQKYRNGLSPVILSAKVRQSWAVIRELFSLYLALDRQAEIVWPSDELIDISEPEKTNLRNLISDAKQVHCLNSNDALSHVMTQPYFRRSAASVERLLELIDPQGYNRAIDIFLEKIPLPVALLAAAQRFEQAERTRSRRIQSILSGRAMGLGKFEASKDKRASFERAHTISLYLRCSVGDVSPETINPPPGSNKAPPACRISKTDREILERLIHMARDHFGQFDNLVDREGQQSLMDVVDQSVRHRWAEPRCNLVKRRHRL